MGMRDVEMPDGTVKKFIWSPKYDPRYPAFNQGPKCTQYFMLVLFLNPITCFNYIFIRLKNRFIFWLIFWFLGCYDFVLNESKFKPWQFSNSEV